MSLDKSRVEIFEGMHDNQEVSGTFKVRHQYKCFEMMNGPKKGKIEVIDGEGHILSVWVNDDDFEYLTTDDVSSPIQTKIKRKELSAKDLSDLIEERFDTLKCAAHGIVDGHMKSLIVSGSAGIGKTHLLNAVLDTALEEEKINTFEICSGSAGAAGLYQAMWDHQEEGDVLMLDDMDRIFYDDEALNILKAGLDTSNRRISWLKESKWLKENEMDKSFEFKGSVIFVTNEDFHRRITQGGRLACHMEALVSRSSYLDLAIHSKRAIMIRINWVVHNTDMMIKVGMNSEQIQQMMEWLIFNQDDLMRLDLRTCLKIAEYMNMNMDKWEQMARSMLLKQNFSY